MTDSPLASVARMGAPPWRSKGWPEGQWPVLVWVVRERVIVVVSVTVSVRVPAPGVGAVTPKSLLAVCTLLNLF